MRYFTKYFWLCLSLFTLNQVLEKAGIFIPLVHSYLDDVLAPGIVLGFVLGFQQQITYRNRGFVFSAWHAVVFVVWYSLIFEVLLPVLDPRHHADPWDVVAYTAGSVLFMVIGNKPTRKLLFGVSPVLHRNSRIPQK